MSANDPKPIRRTKNTAPPLSLQFNFGGGGAASDSCAALLDIVTRSPSSTWVASAPDLGWRPSIYFRKHGVESTQTAETSMHGNRRHRKVGLVEKPLGPLDAGGLSDLHRAGAQVSLEQPGQMP